jgi:hypothetical protein
LIELKLLFQRSDQKVNLATSIDNSIAGGTDMHNLGVIELMRIVGPEIARFT